MTVTKLVNKVPSKVSRSLPRMSRESSATSVNDAEHRRTRILNYGEHLMADSFGHAPTPTIRVLDPQIPPA